MGLFDDLQKQAQQLYDQKRNEIGKLTGDFFGQIVSNASKPAELGSPAAPAPAAAVVSAVTPYMKYAVPAVAVLAVALLLSRRK